MRGSLYLPNPDSTHDLILFAGRFYVPFPPGPALLLLPWVAAAGVGFNEVALSVVVGAVNVALMARLLQSLTFQGHSRLDGTGALWLTALFAAGTVHWVSAATGSVSFLAHICAVTGLTLALWQAAERRPWLAGLGMAWALVCRPTVVLATPAVLALLLAPNTAQQEDGVAVKSGTGQALRWLTPYRCLQPARCSWATTRLASAALCSSATAGCRPRRPSWPSGWRPGAHFIRTSCRRTCG